MVQAFLRLCSAYGRFLSWVADIAGAATFIVMALVFVNAVSRKFLNLPVPASVEITQFLMPFAIMLPMGLAQLTGTHIRVIIFTSRMPRAVARSLYVLAMILGLLLFTWVAWASFGVAMKSLGVNEMVWGAGVRFPLYPTKFAVFVGSVLLGLQFCLDTIKGAVCNVESEAISATDTDGAVNA